LKQASNDTISEAIQYDFVSGPQSRPLIRTLYESGGTFIDFEDDIEQRSISIANDNKQYQVYNFMPPVKRMSIKLNNFEQKYSTQNTGSPQSHILKKNLQIRCLSGYELTFASATSGADDALPATAKYVHTETIGTAVCPDIASYSGTVATEASLGPLYSSSSYSATTYAYPGYYSNVLTTNEKGPRIEEIRFQATSNKMSFKWRTSRNASFNCSEWSTYSPVATGANTKVIDGPLDHNRLQYIIRFENDVWSTADCFSNVRMQVGVYSEMFNQGTFIIDDPKFANAKVNISGRDVLRRALETEVNLPKATNELISTSITKVFDRCNISYDTATWDNVATTVSYNPNTNDGLNNISGWRALDFLMDAVNAGNDDIRFNIDEFGQPQLKKVPTDVEADWTMHYKFNIESLSKSEDSSKQLQRMTVLPTNISVSPEVTIGSFTGTSTSNGTITINYGTFARYDGSSQFTSATGSSGQANAIFVRYETTGTITEVDRRQTGLTFTTATSSAYSITVLGCAPKLKTNLSYAECGNADNIINSKGSTYKRINPFITDTAAMQELCDYAIGLNGDPKKTIDAKMRANPLSELNDNWMVFSKYDYTDDIYGLIEIKETWSNPGLEQSIRLRERGFDLGVFVWDRLDIDHDKPFVNINRLKYDTGFVWDQDIAVNATFDSANYDYTKKRKLT